MICMRENYKGDEEMGVIAKTNPIQSTEINFKSEQEYEDFMKLVKEPPIPSDYVKNLVENYKKVRKNNEK